MTIKRPPSSLLPRPLPTGVRARGSAARSASIVVVEDEEIFAGLIRRQLESKGYRVAAICLTAEEALDLLEELKKNRRLPDLVMMDVRLRGKTDGIEAAQKIRDHYDCAVVIMTGFGDEVLLERVLAVKPMAYLMKPFDVRQMCATISLALRQKKMEVSLLSHQKEILAINRRLQSEMEERIRLAKWADTIIEQEKERMGRDLHDELGQVLAGMAIKGQVLRSQLSKMNVPAEKIAGEIVELAGRAASQVRDLSRGLFPLVLQTKGVAAAFEELAAYIRNHLEVECRFECEESMARSLDRLTSTNLYRMTQESLTNAVKHGHARRIEIRLAREGDGRGVLTIDDDGVGFKAEEASRSNGMGLRGMRYRAGLINGTVEIGPGPSGGTRVKCVFLGAEPPNDAPARKG